jgi:chromosome segregation ATPase
MSEGDAAVIECRSLLTGSEDQGILGGRTSDVSKALEASTKGQIVDLILPMQGRLNSRPGENAALSTVGIDANAESQNNALNSMIGMAEEDMKRIVTSLRTDGSPTERARGDLVDAMRDRDALAVEEMRLNQLSNDLQNLIQVVNELEIEMGQEETEDDIQERIDELRQEADAHQVSREAAEKAVREADEVVTPLQTQHTQRVQLREQDETLTNQNTQLTGQMIERRENHERAEGVLKTRSEHFEDAKTKLEALNQWINFVQRQDAVVSQRQELEGLETDRDQLKDAIDKVAEIQSELNGITLATPEQFERIRVIGQEIASIRGAADAWSITEFSPGKDHRIFIDGEEIEEAPESVNTSI